MAALAAALAEFQASRAGVRGLVESGVASVPPIFQAPSCLSPPAPPGKTFSTPTIDLSLPRSAVMSLFGAAARRYGFFHVTNHGMPDGLVISAVRAFHELPLAIRSTLYALTPVGSVRCGTLPYPPGQNAAGLLPWRDVLRVTLGPAPDLGHIPAACRAALLEYLRCVGEFGKKMAGLLSEALGVGAERLDSATQVAPWMLSSHYYPPCPEPARVVGCMEHTDPSIFTVLAQDGVQGFQVRLDDEEWMDAPPMPGALLINIGDVLKMVSNDEYKSVEHRVQIRSSEDVGVTVAVPFNSAKHHGYDLLGPLPELVTAERDGYDLLGPLPELVTEESPQRYRSFTMTEFMSSRTDFGHARSSTDRFRPAAADE